MFTKSVWTSSIIWQSLGCTMDLNWKKREKRKWERRGKKESTEYWWLYWEKSSPKIHTKLCMNINYDRKSLDFIGRAFTTATRRQYIYYRQFDQKVCCTPVVNGHCCLLSESFLSFRLFARSLNTSSFWSVFPEWKPIYENNQNNICPNIVLYLLNDDIHNNLCIRYHLQITLEICLILSLNKRDSKSESHFFLIKLLLFTTHADTRMYLTFEISFEFRRFVCLRRKKVQIECRHYQINW